jgi:CBS domain containing-hemolysin-like protein
VNNSQILILVVLILIDLLLTAIELVTRRARTRSTLKLSQALLRFLIAGLILLNFIIPDLNQIIFFPFLSYLLLIGLVIWLLEFIMERVILQDPESWSVRLTPIANILIKTISPLLYLPLKLSQTVESRNLVTITEDELIHLVDASQRAGQINKDESEMIHSVFEFGDTLAREIMVPRVDMLALDVNTPLDTAADSLLESGFSRVPVYENQIDNIIGLLYTKDMLQVWRVGDEISSLRNLLRPARFVPETKKVDELLDEMQAARIHISIVVDEYGGVAGLVTLEDIIEEIFGEIQDEYDDGEESLWEQVGPSEYIFDGRILLDDINEMLNTALPTDDADTIGGLVFSRIGSVPNQGDMLTEAGIEFTVEALQERRVHKVRAIINETEPHTETEDYIDDHS